MMSFRIEDILRTELNKGVNKLSEENVEMSSDLNKTEKSRRRQRYTFSSAQVNCLETVFYYNRYISQERRAQLACYLGLTEQQVKIWFQNRRYKAKVRVDETKETTSEQPFPLHAKNLSHFYYFMMPEQNVWQLSNSSTSTHIK